MILKFLKFQSFEAAGLLCFWHADPSDFGFVAHPKYAIRLYFLNLAIANFIKILKILLFLPLKILQNFTA
ncbi:MAG: hypothetical protein D8H92_07705 [Campylobacter sp.]|nr:MAG: hypothetical protein D8H92_07705 [Campylobacter sp.]